MEYLSFFHVLSYQVSYSMEKWAYIFPHHLFAADVSVEAFVFTLHIPLQI